ncbi:alpha/beta hydrolase [Streptomyces sp. FH025]|uniref:alpha/beta hydrolase n=1 Tax=Streptomyces sp. FH025 TaxID=2815937 RepID=UPI001A9CDCBB|nr:alpha/beta hydrolase [Streptomyces sp. FH025]MBO1417716.1 alpha/beta hydrolase [Streptomyces sp. FH025]
MSDPVEIHTHYPSPAGDFLPLLGYAPAAAPPRAAVVLFHGGGWQTGMPEQFAPQTRALAAHGILALSAGYRLLGQGARSVGDCVDDARAVARHARKLAAEHGAAGAPLFLGGGSAGGQLALALGSETSEETPYAGLVLFNPAVDLLEEAWLPLLPMLGLTEEAAKACSPLHLVRPGTPPALLLHGTADQLVPIASARRYRDAQRAAGNDCRLVEYQGAPHGFFNPDTDDPGWFRDTTDRAVRFVLDHLDPLV